MLVWDTSEKAKNWSKDKNFLNVITGGIWQRLFGQIKKKNV